MTRTAALLCVLASTLMGCSTSPPVRLVLLNRATGSRYVGTVVANREASMTASIEVNGLFFSGKFDPSSGNAVTTLVGTGGDLLQCVFHFDLRTRTGVGECMQAGPRSFAVTLSD